MFENRDELIAAYDDHCDDEGFATAVYRTIGLPQDAIEWLLEYGDEGYVAHAMQIVRYGHYSWLTFTVMTESELADYLNYDDITEDDYNERFGFIIRDAAFEGVLVIGE